MRCCVTQICVFLFQFFLKKYSNSFLVFPTHFCDEKNLNILDCNLKKISNSTNINSLIADKVEDHKYKFNIYLQGDKETIFFDI